MVNIAKKEKPDWNAIKAEYISGEISQAALGEKYHIPYATIRDRAQKEGWTDAREMARRKGSEKAAEKVAKVRADAAASNAKKLEKARAMLIDRILIALEQMPQQSGTRIRQSQYDKEKNKQVSVDYDLTTLVSAFEKLSTGTTAEAERQKQFTKENNTILMGYADLFSRPARTRTLEELEGGPDV